jgi:hypothetical protein
MMRDPSLEFKIEHKKRKSIYYNELIRLGIFEETEPGIVILNFENLRKHSVVVNDELFDNITDIDWAREQRSKLGLIQGEVKGPEFRARQQARRKKRKAYAKEQRAKLQAQPSEELPLSEVIFDDSILELKNNSNDEQDPN